MSGFFTSPVSRLLSGFKRAVIELVEDDEPPGSPQRPLVPPPSANLLTSFVSKASTNTGAASLFGLRNDTALNNSTGNKSPTTCKVPRQQSGLRSPTYRIAQHLVEDEDELDLCTTEPIPTPLEPSDGSSDVIRSSSGDNVSISSQTTVKSFTAVEEEHNELLQATVAVSVSGASSGSQTCDSRPKSSVEEDKTKELTGIMVAKSRKCQNCRQGTHFGGSTCERE